MIPNPIHKVLSTLRSRKVKHLLMGGQPCVFYGAAEFSRDTDIAVLAEKDNLARILSAMKDLSDEVIAVPQFNGCPWSHTTVRKPMARLRRVNSVIVFKDAAEVKRVFNADLISDFRNGLISPEKEN